MRKACRSEYRMSNGKVVEIDTPYLIISDSLIKDLHACSRRSSPHRLGKIKAKLHDHILSLHLVEKPEPCGLATGECDRPEYESLCEISKSLESNKLKYVLKEFSCPYSVLPIGMLTLHSKCLLHGKELEEETKATRDGFILSMAMGIEEKSEKPDYDYIRELEEAFNSLEIQKRVEKIKSCQDSDV